MCSPRGVQKLPCCSPAPLREVDTRYRLSAVPWSLRSVSVWSGIEISIFGTSASCRAPRRKKLRKQAPRLGRENAARHRRVVVEFLFRKQIHDAAAGAGLGVGRAIHEPRDARMHDGARAHGAGLERHVERAAFQTVVAEFLSRFAQGLDL